MVDFRARAVRSILDKNRPAVFCFGLTAAGYPKHPLYIKTGTSLKVYHGESSKEPT
jgi:hypothetical protein